MRRPELLTNDGNANGRENGKGIAVVYRLLVGGGFAL